MANYKMTNDEAKTVLFNMLGKGIFVEDTKENQAILAALRALEREPKTGYWYVDERPESDREVICSNCEQSVFKYHKLDFDYRPKYCPNCGAKMEDK